MTVKGSSIFSCDYPSVTEQRDFSMQTAKDWAKAKLRDADFIFGCWVISLAPLFALVAIGMLGDSA